MPGYKIQGSFNIQVICHSMKIENKCWGGGCKGMGGVEKHTSFLLDNKIYL